MRSDIDISFAERTRVEMGLTPEQNTLTYIDVNGVEQEEQIIFSDSNDNACFLYPEPYGTPSVYYDQKNNPKRYIVIRKKISDGKGKYKNPYGVESLPFIPPAIVTKVRAGMQIETLFITEGAKKAFVASVNGIDCIGISGIFQFKPKGAVELHPYIIEIKEACQVKNFVLLFDADALNLTSHDNTLQAEDLISKDMAFRCNGFVAAAKNFKESCFGLNVSPFVGYINPELGPKGLDDLILAMPNDKDAIVADILLLSKAESYFIIHALKDNSYSKLNVFFGIDSVDNFYKIRQDKLGLNDFNFRNKIYRFSEQTGKVDLSENDFIKFYDLITNAKGIVVDVKIDPKLFLQLLTEYGFRIYRLNVNEFVYVRIQNNVVSIISSKDIKGFVLAYINKQKLISEPEKHDVINKLLLFSSLFSKEILEVLPTIAADFHTDTSTEIFFYFKNGFLEVTAKALQLKPYTELTGYIWESEIIQNDYLQPKQGLFKDFSWVKFVQNICSIKNKEGKWEVDQDRYESLCTIIGYILHRFKKERKAIVFTDTDINDKPEGRTGKTLIAKGLGQLRPYAEVDGKNYDSDNRFKHQNVNLDTQIVHINDAGRGKKKFDFELMFTAVTEGLTVEKKNQISFVNHSVIIISSNRAIEINGGSARARVIEFEFANYYSDTFSPKDEFGQWFFTDWDHREWNLFYYFLFNCCRSYLANGIIKSDAINLDKRKLLQATGNNDDFLEFAETEIPKNIDKEVSKRELLAKFKQENPEYDKLTSQTFTKWLDAYAVYKKYKIVPGTKSNGDRLIKFTSQGKT